MGIGEGMIEGTVEGKGARRKGLGKSKGLERRGGDIRVKIEQE